MRTAVAIGLFGLLTLAGCASWNRPYVSDKGVCDELVDARARLDCIARAEQAEDDWREEKRREDDWKDEDG